MNFGPHGCWHTTSASNAAEAGHPCLQNIVQGTVCKILARHEVRPHKVRYYLERRDEAFETKMADALCVYREVAVLRANEDAETNVAVISYDEKPGIQAIGNVAPDLPPQPGSHASFARDHEYKRHGTLSLLAGIDMLTGQVHACIEDRHRSREFIGFLKHLDAAYPPDTAIKLILDNHSAHISKDQGVDRRPTRWPLLLRVHTETRLVAQSRGGVLLQDGTLNAPTHPCRLKGRTQSKDPCLS
jgi:hypothetical protein